MHHAALPYDDMPDFMERLRQEEGTAARPLEFLILKALVAKVPVSDLTWLSAGTQELMLSRRK
jgi:hypothetical protein